MNPAFPAKEPQPGELRSCGEPDEAPLIPCSPEDRFFRTAVHRAKQKP